MSSVYDRAGIRFRYPEDWELTETPHADGLTVSLQSPASMFLFVTIYDKPLPPEELVEQAVATMSEEYRDLDSSPVREFIADCPAVGRDINFFSLDLTNTCWVRAFSAGRRTVLIFAQTSDLDLESSEPAFQELCSTLELTGDRAGL